MHPLYSTGIQMVLNWYSISGRGSIGSVMSLFLEGGLYMKNVHIRGSLIPLGHKNCNTILLHFFSLDVFRFDPLSHNQCTPSIKWAGVPVSDSAR